MKDTQTVIAFAPHPDDAEIFCGGLLARLSKAGNKTAIIDLTKGELSSQGNLETRAKETENASNILGLSYRENLEIPDGSIDNSYISRVVQCIRRLRPEIVLLPYWESRHPDHRAASDLVQRSLFFAGVKKYLPQDSPAHRPKAEIYYQMRVSFKPSFISDISSFQETKMKAVRAYRSQILRDTDPEDGSPPTLISSPLSLSSIEARDAYYGAMIGSQFGEPYLVKSAIRIDDPLKHFTSEQKDSALIF